MYMSSDIAKTITDPKAYAEWDPVHEAFRELRANAPVAKAQPENYGEFWVVSRYEDIQHIEKNMSGVFHCGDRSSTLVPLSVETFMREMTGGMPSLIRSLVQIDNPDHIKLRQLTQAWFMPQNLKKNLEERVRAIAKSFVDQMLEKGDECDFATDVAFLYPLHVIMEVIGVPKADEPRMLMLTQQLFGSADAELNRSGENEMTAEQANEMLGAVVADFNNYFTAMSDDRRANPKEDLATIIATAQIDGEPIKFMDAMGYYIIAATAGHDTTSASTAGAMIEAAKNPNIFKQMKGDRSKVAGFVEEAIRWETPVKHFMRTATEDTEVGGQKIAKDDYLYVSYTSANRDESVFDDAFTFNPERTPNRHLAFGYGPHVCLGQHLARLEMKCLWEELLTRVDSVELAGEPKRMAAAFVCGPKSVPIRFKAA